MRRVLKAVPADGEGGGREAPVAGESGAKAGAAALEGSNAVAGGAGGAAADPTEAVGGCCPPRFGGTPPVKLRRAVTLHGRHEPHGSHAVGLAATAERLLSVGWDGNLRAWNERGDAAMPAMQHNRVPVGDVEDAVRSILLLSEKRVFTGGQDGRLCEFDLTSGSCVRRLKAHDAGILGLAAVRGGSLLVTCGTDVDAAGGDAKSPPGAAPVTPPRSSAAAAHLRATRWTPGRCTKRAEHDSDRADRYTDGEGANSKGADAGDEMATLKVWDAESLELLHVVDMSGVHSGRPCALAAAPAHFDTPLVGRPSDVTSLVFTGAWDSVVGVWDLGLLWRGTPVDASTHVPTVAEWAARVQGGQGSDGTSAVAALRPPLARHLDLSLGDDKVEWVRHLVVGRAPGGLAVGPCLYASCGDGCVRVVDAGVASMPVVACVVAATSPRASVFGVQCSMIADDILWTCARDCSIRAFDLSRRLAPLVEVANSWRGQAASWWANALLPWRGRIYVASGGGVVTRVALSPAAER